LVASGRGVPTPVFRKAGKQGTCGKKSEKKKALGGKEEHCERKKVPDGEERELEWDVHRA
jgi:hypothetical protein